MRALLLVALLPGAAWAETLAESHFGFNFCYAQSFDGAHLREHPEQRVRSIRLNREPAGTMRMLGVLPVELRVRLRDGGEELRALADCRTDGNGLSCDMARGPGGFALEAEGDGIRLTVSPGGLALAGWADEVRLEADEGGDREFLVRRCG